jgi:hypothetical protein
MREMKGIEIKSGCVFYYGNPAGYVDSGTAVLDNMFRGDELDSWITKSGLTPKWSDGVYDRLANGAPAQAGELPAPQKSCRIWQLRPDVDPMMKFVSYAETTGRFGEPDPANYILAYDGQLGTNDLEEIWTRLNQDDRPPGYTGYSLSMSDVIELYDHSGSEFHFVDRFGFKEIGFDGQAPEQAQGMNMSM